MQVSYFTWPGGPAAIGPTFARIARNAEAAGLSSLWVMDHFWQIDFAGPPELDMLEAYTALGYAAACTERIDLGALVTAVTHRHPGVLAKTVSTLDVLSGGRAWLGIGAGWNEAENRGLGLPFPLVAERFERLEETLQICRQMFAGDERPYAGRHYQLDRPLNVPAPLRRVPILVGGSGPRKTLRLVAQYADACNFFNYGTDWIVAGLDTLRRHCRDLGRDPDEIEKTVLTRMPLGPAGRRSRSGEPYVSVDQGVAECARLAELGFDTVILGMANDADDEAYPLLAELVRQV